MPTQKVDTSKTPMPDRDAQVEQNLRFRVEVQKRIDAGELNPTEADEALDNLVRSSDRASPKPRRD
jgi:hypothetical protein